MIEMWRAWVCALIGLACGGVVIQHCLPEPYNILAGVAMGSFVGLLMVVISGIRDLLNTTSSARVSKNPGSVSR